MRRFALFLLLAPLSMAQSLSPAENFDRGGLPANPRTQIERDLVRRISTHRRGDTADALDIQRKLASYYRANGDLTRARLAEERGKAAPPPPPGDVLSIPVYQPEAGQPATAPATEAVPQPDPIIAEPAPAPAPEFSGGRFYALQGGMLHTWEFAPDGSFKHAWAPAGAAPTSAANFEAGTFHAAAGFLMLNVVRGSTAQPLGVGGRQLRMELRGPAGRDGLMLNGIPLKPKRP